MNPENSQPSENEHREPVPLEEVLLEFADQYPEAVEEMAEQERQRKQAALEKERDNAVQEFHDIHAKEEQGEATEEDEDKLDEIRHEIWNKDHKLLNPEDQITKDEQ